MPNRKGEMVDFTVHAFKTFLDAAGKKLDWPHTFSIQSLKVGCITSVTGKPQFSDYERHVLGRHKPRDMPHVYQRPQWPQIMDCYNKLRLAAVSDFIETTGNDIQGCNSGK